MSVAPNTSFIPKRGPVKHNRQTAARQIHLFTIFSYVFFFATLVATVAIFFYNRYIDDIRTEEITRLNGALGDYNQTEMSRVLEFNTRLKQANYRLQNSVSTASIFDALEAATVQSVRLVDLKLSRDKDSQFNLTAQVEADSFDSSLFQRGIFERNPIINSVEVSELGLINGDETADASLSPASGVLFTAKLGVPLKSVPYIPPTATIIEPEPEVVIPVEISTSTAEEAAAVTDDNQPSL